MNGLQGNCCILKTDTAWGLQKLDLILENEVPLILKLCNGIINKLPILIINNSNKKPFSDSMD